ncbi:MAG TPA: ATP-binding cassette domain-containing protein [Gaiellaceae bacterium]|nr:ATP-binding cassette domain-containing protein [Gaiellaceae bacterium]
MSILAARAITKSYGPTLANDAIDIDLAAGEVHALLGQNGAGKSTLVGVLTGRVAPDEGTVTVGGVEVPAGDPAASASAGIATVFQELMLVPSMTGLENIALALGLPANRATRRRAEAVRDEFQLPANLDVPVRLLGLPERQRIELIRALCQRPSILLLDEPTSLLTPTAIPGFLAKVQELARSGIAVLLITHRLDEALAIADKLTVLRQGRKIVTHTPADMPSSTELAIEMLGVRVADHVQIAPPAEEVVLQVRDLAVLDEHRHRRVDGISFDLRRGEILGVAGVDGNGQVELLEAIVGLRPALEGTLTYRGSDVTGTDYCARRADGTQLVSGDRQRYGIVPTFTVSQHFEYALGRDVLGRLPEILTTYDVRPPAAALRADRLSGGNQQKLVIACACERDVDLLALAYPTHGLDLQASLAVRQLLARRAAEDGVAIVFAGSELPELLSVSHRVAVLNRGRIIGIQSRDAFDAAELAEWFTHTEPVSRQAV